MSTESAAENLTALVETFDTTLDRFARARKANPRASSLELLEVARRLMATPGGLDVLYRRVADLEAATIFGTSDWSAPARLQPALVRWSLREGRTITTVVEVLSEIRLLAVALGDYFHPGISDQQARHFLTQVMALNLDLLSGRMTEADRARPDALGPIVVSLYQYLVAHLGYDNILDRLVDEVWRLLAQGPVQVDNIKEMVVQIGHCLFEPRLHTAGMDRAARLVHAVFGPTDACRDQPALDIYSQRLVTMDEEALAGEAGQFADAMDDTGLVSTYHALFLRYLRNRLDPLIPTALGLSATGIDALNCYSELVHTLIDEAVYPETCQAVYGLAMMLERRTLSIQVAQALWRQIHLKLSAETSATLSHMFGDAHPPAGIPARRCAQPPGSATGRRPGQQSHLSVGHRAFHVGGPSGRLPAPGPGLGRPG